MTGLDLAVRSDPWVVSFGVLDQVAPVKFSCHRRGPVSDPFQPIADPSPLSWNFAAGVREEQRTPHNVTAVLDTDHSEARTTANIEIERLGEDRVSVVVEIEGALLVGQDFSARPGERFLGFGERSHALSFDVGVIENYVGEGTFQPHEYPFLSETVPKWGIRNRRDATYFPVPWVVSTRGYGLSIDQDDLSYVRMRTDRPDEWSIEVEADRLAYTIYAGPTPLEALRRFTEVHGRQPAPERWFFGPWYQSGHANHVPPEEEHRQLDALGGTAVSAVETHCRYLPLGEDRGHEDDERARTTFFHSRGLAVLSDINPLVGEEYVEAFETAERAGALQRRESGEPYLFQAYVGGRVPPHTSETQYDFRSPSARDCWGEILERIVSAGYDGWMEDFGEYTPVDAFSYDGSTGIAAHNRYPTDYHGVAASVTEEFEGRARRRFARFVRSGWTGTTRFVPIVWGGDPTTSWGFNGLASAVIEGLSMGASGVAMWGSDTGGFMSTMERLTPELLRRWIQFSAFCPVMRTKAGGIEIPPYERPQIWDPDVLPSWRRWARWHTRLNDYLMAAHETYRRTGRPIMCALELVYPDMGPVDHQYLLGESLLIAPVLEPGCTVRRVVLPEGRWFNLFDPSQSFMGQGVTGLEVGPHDIPVFVRSGAVLALLPEDTDSLSPYAPEPGDRRSVLAIVSSETGAWSGSLGPGLSCRTETNEQSWTLELLAPRRFDWDVTAWLPTPPTRIEAGGSWTYSSGTLRWAVSGDAPVLRVGWTP